MNPEGRDAHLLAVGVHHGFRYSLPLVVASAWPNGIHVAPVGLSLRVLLGIAVHLPVSTIMQRTRGQAILAFIHGDH